MTNTNNKDLINTHDQTYIFRQGNATGTINVSKMY